MRFGCNADISKIGLVGWASGDCPYPYPLWLGNIGPKDGDYIVGTTGEMAAARPEIAQYTGQIVMLPIFDYIYTGTCNSSKHEICMETQFSGEPQPIDRWVTGSSAYYYHIIGMVSVRLSQVAGKSIYGEFVESVIRPGEIIPGAGIRLPVHTPNDGCSALGIEPNSRGMRTSVRIPLFQSSRRGYRSATARGLQGSSRSS